MRLVICVLMGLSLSLAMLVGCEKDERRVQRTEKIEHRSEPTPTVVPD